MTSVTSLPLLSATGTVVPAEVRHSRELVGDLRVSYPSLAGQVEERLQVSLAADKKGELISGFLWRSLFHVRELFFMLTWKSSSCAPPTAGEGVCVCD